MKRLCLLLAALLILSAFIGCGSKQAEEPSSSEAPSESSSLPEVSVEESKPPPPPDSVFVNREPDNWIAVNEAAEWVREQLDDINNTGEPVPERAQFADLFNEGNAAYRSEDYELAKSIYLDVIAACPGHSGAINNLALACIQLEDYELALRYCILNRVLNPGFYAGWINLQVAGHALGFRPAMLQDLLDDEFADFPSLFAYEDAIVQDFPDQDIQQAAIMVAYLYNAVYADMEYEPALDDVAAMDLGMALEVGEITEEEYEQRKLGLYLDDLERSMKALADNNPDDRDIQLLREYLSALRTLRERQQ